MNLWGPDPAVQIFSFCKHWVVIFYVLVLIQEVFWSWFIYWSHQNPTLNNNECDWIPPKLSQGVSAGSCPGCWRWLWCDWWGRRRGWLWSSQLEAGGLWVKRLSCQQQLRHLWFMTRSGRELAYQPQFKTRISPLLSSQVGALLGDLCIVQLWLFKTSIDWLTQKRTESFLFLTKKKSVVRLNAKRNMYYIS